MCVYVECLKGKTPFFTCFKWHLMALLEEKQESVSDGSSQLLGSVVKMNMQLLSLGFNSAVERLGDSKWPTAHCWPPPLLLWFWKTFSTVIFISSYHPVGGSCLPRSSWSGIYFSLPNCVTRWRIVLYYTFTLMSPWSFQEIPHIVRFVAAILKHSLSATYIQIPKTS